MALTNVDLNIFLAQHLGIDALRNQVVAALFGVGLIGAYYSIGAVFYFFRAKKSLVLQELGPIRYGLTAFLFLTMMALPIKMILRWTFNIKYILTLPWIGLNI